MNGQVLNIARRIRSRVLWSAILATPLWACSLATAAEEPMPTPPQASAPQTTAPPPFGMRYGGGVLEESYFRGLQRPMQSQIEMGGIPTATGGCNYGFPMQSFRWGYFGAQPQNPRTIWHKKYYNGEEIRTTYRYGY